MTLFNYNKKNSSIFESIKNLHENKILKCKSRILVTKIFVKYWNYIKHIIFRISKNILKLICKAKESFFHYKYFHIYLDYTLTLKIKIPNTYALF